MFVCTSNERQLSRDSPLLWEAGGTVSRYIVIEIVHTNTILGHTWEVATNSTHVLPICSHLNSSSDSQKARTATIL